MIFTVEKWCNHMEKVKVGPEVPCALQRASDPNYKYFPGHFRIWVHASIFSRARLGLGFCP